MMLEYNEMSGCSNYQRLPPEQNDEFSPNTSYSFNNTNLNATDKEYFCSSVKEELRTSIQQKRTALGLPETIDTKIKQQLSAEPSREVLQKREKRRERNKVAAAKCRFKKRIVSEKLQEESEHLENVNLKLQQEIQQLKKERDELETILTLHKINCIILKPD